MAAIATSIIVLPAIVGIFIGVLILLRRRYPARPDTLVDAIDALLPQTQCAQCGYPGCRPYAEAISNGAALDQCPPGGADTQKALARLLERPSGAPVGAAIPVVARIDEQACIGCFLCVEACPVDAIVGAPKFMHTVIESRCTGCELCVAPCPVDCIELKPLPVLLIEPAPAAAAACIRCNRCVDACPEDLAPQTLWWLSRGPDLSAARSEGLDACIECGLCNDECPAAIDLVGVFKHARSRLAVADQARQRAIRARALADEREQRLEDAAVRAASRRARRLGALPDTAGPKEPAP